MDKLQAYVESFRDSIFSTELLHHYLEKFILYFSNVTLDEVQNIIAATATSFVLIFSAEMGDKSQLVCMTLASKHRPGPVILGALAAFALLNALAVAFGQAIANWFPDYVIAGMVAFLFIVFGIQALRTTAEEQNDDIKEKSGQGIFFATFLLITFAEFGDKTQLAIVALSSTSNLIGVWLGSTLALGY